MWVVASGYGVHPAILSDAQGRVCTQAEETNSNGALGGFLELVTFGQGLIGYTKCVLAALSL